MTDDQILHIRGAFLTLSGTLDVLGFSRAIVAQAHVEMRRNACYWQDPDNSLALPSAVCRVGWIPLAPIPKEPTT